MSACILVVDDDPDFVEGLETRFTSWGFQVESALDGHQALEILRRRSLSGMTLGANMPGMNGVEVLKRVRHIAPSLPVIMISAGFHYLKEEDLNFLKQQAQDLLDKPVHVDEFKRMVDTFFAGSTEETKRRHQ